MSKRSYSVNQDLSASLHLFVAFAPGTRDIDVQKIAGAGALGVLTQVYTDVSVQWGVVTDGPDFVVITSGGVFAANDFLACDAAGRAVKLTTADQVPLGIAREASTGAGQLVQMEPLSGGDVAPGGPTGLIYSATSDGPTLTAAAAASMLPTASKITIPGSTFNAGGQILEIHASGKLSTVITTPGTLRFDVRLGGVVVADTLAMLPDTVAAHVNVGWDLVMYLTFVAPGGTAAFICSGYFSCEDLLGVPATAPKGNLVAQFPWNSNPTQGTAFNSQAALAFDMYFTQTVASGSLTCNRAWAELKPLAAKFT